MCYNVDKVELVTKGQMLYGSTYMRHLEKSKFTKNSSY